MLITGSSVASTRTAIELVRQQPQRYRCTAGVHPHHATDLDAAQLARIAELARAPEVVAVGECGLDYFRDFSPRAAQLRCVSRQLELAVASGQAGLPASTRCARRFRRRHREFRPRLAGGVAHCFTGGLEEARAYLDLDLYIGITGWICDERRGQHLREVVRHIPADRLLIETDAPYLLPRDLKPMPQSRRNEPMYLPHILRCDRAARAANPPQELARDHDAKRTDDCSAGRHSVALTHEIRSHEQRALDAYIVALWDDSIVPTLCDYIRIPNKSANFDPQWAEHGHMDRAAELMRKWCEANALPGMKIEIVRLPGRTPLLFVEIPAAGRRSMTIAC